MLLTAFGIITGLVTLLGLYSFIPRVKITLGVQDPARPFSARFNIENNSVFAMTDLNIDCRIHRAQIGGMIFENSTLTMTEQTHVSRIGRDSQAAVQCGVIGNVAADSADMTLDLSFTYMRKSRQVSANFLLLDSGNWVPKLPPRKA